MGPATGAQGEQAAEERQWQLGGEGHRDGGDQLGPAIGRSGVAECVTDEQHRGEQGRQAVTGPAR
ncbi:hypothetical protein [Kitasatospora sp. NPDC059571]|uniref:hypothetical protein n=1 Tax=Kitasatospora sp. NPDC059571 TaxID=3346871 RepID=UPI003685F664